uniref:Uncharacterized protein n=1 Tax=Ditylum brightwellii TaxID=49249 RepID=A0A7S4RI37_9STRA
MVFKELWSSLESLMEAETEPQGTETNDTVYQQMKESSSASWKRLVEDFQFRRFLVEKSLHLITGQSAIIRAGHRLDTLLLQYPNMGFDEHDGCTDDEYDAKMMQSHLIAASLQLGPLLFTEFCSCSYNQSHTSLHGSGKASSSCELPLATLALKAFVACIRRIAIDIGQHSLSKAKRVSTLIHFAVHKASSCLPTTKDRWDFFPTSTMTGAGEKDTHDIKEGVSNEDMELRRVLKAVISPIVPYQNGDKVVWRGGLLSELVAHCMDMEATECCDLLESAASVIEDPDIRQQMGVYLLRCWDYVGPEVTWTGILGLEHDCSYSGSQNCSKSASKALEVAIALGGHLDGDTPIPPPPKAADSFDDLPRETLCRHRKMFGLPLSRFTDWPENHIDHMERIAKSGNEAGLFGNLQKISQALLSQLGIGANFEGTFKKQPPRTSVEISCVQIVASAAPPTGFLVPRELGSTANYIFQSIDASLSDVEFVVQKMLSPLRGVDLELVQNFACCRLLGASKIIGTVTACAEEVDDVGSFAALLLRSEMNERMTPRIMSLLLTVQEKSNAGDGKLLADSKIESHGRIAAQLVFEKEMSDTALLKMSAKLKAMGFEGEKAWLEKQVVASVSRDFRIKRNEIKAAREREGGSFRKKVKKEKAAGSRKRKENNGGAAKKKKARKEDENEELVHDDDEQNTSIQDDESMSNDEEMEEGSLQDDDEDDDENELTDTDDE